jgi:hypothetical protein
MKVMLGEPNGIESQFFPICRLLNESVQAIRAPQAVDGSQRG